MKYLFIMIFLPKHTVQRQIYDYLMIFLCVCMYVYIFIYLFMYSMASTRPLQIETVVPSIIPAASS